MNRYVLVGITSLALVFVVALNTCVPAVALESKTINRENGVSAYARWSEEADRVYTYTYLSVIETKDETVIYFEIYKYNESTDNSSYIWGNIFTEEDVFDVDKKLTTAILSPVEIDMYGWEDEKWIEETITIQAQWTSEGDLIKGSFKTMSKYGDFMSKFSDQSKRREAIANGFMNDLDLGVSEFGELVEFRYAEMWIEK